MERFYVLVAVLDGNTITESNTFYLVIYTPLSCLTVYKETFIFLCVCIRSKRSQFVGGVKDQDIALFEPSFCRFVKVCCRNMSLRSKCVFQVNIDRSSHESCKRKLSR